MVFTLCHINHDALETAPYNLKLFQNKALVPRQSIAFAVVFFIQELYA